MTFCIFVLFLFFIFIFWLKGLKNIGANARTGGSSKKDLKHFNVDAAQEVKLRERSVLPLLLDLYTGSIISDQCHFHCIVFFFWSVIYSI